ncbi:MAG TPA: hypothetical protein VI942_08950 [Thermoanaerobaculia bacterium]|nr:hypothetical protein [Thermoanaerobaculia bacterium]
MSRNYDDHRTNAERLTADDLPRFAVFLSSYLNDDSSAAASSAARAAYDYAAEAELDELGELAREWEIVCAAAREMGVERFNAALRDRFRSSWRVVAIAEVDAAFEELTRALRE